MCKTYGIKTPIFYSPERRHLAVEKWTISLSRSFTARLASNLVLSWLVTFQNFPNSSFCCYSNLTRNNGMTFSLEFFLCERFVYIQKIAIFSIFEAFKPAYSPSISTNLVLDIESYKLSVICCKKTKIGSLEAEKRPSIKFLGKSRAKRAERRRRLLYHTYGWSLT